MNTGETEDDSGFNIRSQILLQAMARMPRPGRDIPRRIMFHAIARLGTDQNVTQALRDIAEVNENPGDASMFFRHANIDVYLRFGYRFPESLRETIRHRMLNYTYAPRTPGGTENH